MFVQRRTTKLEAIRLAIERADLEDALLCVRDLPGQLFQIRLLALANLNISFREVRRYISDRAAVTPRIKTVGTGANVVDVEFPVLIGVRSVVVSLALTKCGDRRVAVVTEKDSGASSGSAVAKEELALHFAAGLEGFVVEPLVRPHRFLLLPSRCSVVFGSVVEIPQPGAPDLAVREGVAGSGLVVRAVNHIELDGVAGFGFAVDL